MCCWQRPCEFTPDDVTRAAKLLSKTARQLFDESLCVDYVHYGTNFVRAARASGTRGALLTSEETYAIDTPCTFLDVANGNACRIHQAKPKAGRQYGCWAASYNPQIPTWTAEQLSAIGWDGYDSDD